MGKIPKDILSIGSIVAVLCAFFAFASSSWIGKVEADISKLQDNEADRAVQIGKLEAISESIQKTTERIERKLDKALGIAP
jgi:hypothetical protein